MIVTGRALAVQKRRNKDVHSEYNTMVKSIFRYLKKTCSYKLRYKKEELSLTAYSDADFAGDPITRRSTSGAVLLLAGGPIA